MIVQITTYGRASDPYRKIVDRFCLVAHPVQGHGVHCERVAYFRRALVDMRVLPPPEIREVCASVGADEWASLTASAVP